MIRGNIKKWILILTAFLLCFLITSLQANSNQSVSNAKNYIYKIQYRTEVNQLLNQIRPSLMRNSLEVLSNFPDRASDTTSGFEAISWLQSQIEMMIKASGRKDVSILLVETKTKDENGNPIVLKQPSIIVKLGYSNEAGIVVGSHLDTYEKYDLKTSEEMCKDIQNEQMKKLCKDTLSGDKPGADDDGSGASVALEVARTLINSNMQFRKPIYLIWYAAEEIGMVGSQNVVEYFQNKNIAIQSVIQLDQVGYTHEGDPTIWLVDNYVDADLTAYLADLVHEYVKRPILYTSCRGPCSDHVSWNMKGVPVAFPFESEMVLGRGNPFVHTPADTIDKLSLAHMTDFTKLTLAFAVELAEPI